MEDQTTVLPQDEIQNEESVMDIDSEESVESETGDESNQHQADVEDMGDVELLKAELAKEKSEAAKLRRLLEKKSKPVEQSTSTQDLLAVEETVLKAQGTSQDELDFLKRVAKVVGTGMIDAKNDPLFVAWKQQKDEKDKSEKARLGASRGSGKVSQEKSFSTPGLSQEDHKKMWKDKFSR
jgi:hypothetical protein